VPFYNAFSTVRLAGVIIQRHMANQRSTKSTRATNDDALGWIGIALVLVAAIVLDKGAPSHKWHAAIMWTFVAFFGVLIFGRNKRGSWRFWIFCVACFVLHVFGMWVIFAHLLPRLVLGTLYVVPLAFIESIFLVGMFSKLEHKLAPAGTAFAVIGETSPLHSPSERTDVN